MKKEKQWSRFETGSGVSTPRGGLSELKNPAIVNNSRSRSPKTEQRVDPRVNEHTGFIFEDHAPTPQRYSPPTKRSIMDKWAALGDRRRGPQQTPQKTTKPAKQGQPTPNSARKRSRTGSWKRPIHWGPTHHENASAWERKDNWNLSKDWRQHPNNMNDDIGDLEWVGGWNDLHL